MPNSVYFCIGKFFISYSIKEIKKGEEITIRYNNRSLTYEDRQEKLLKYWEFKCNCQLCEYQKKHINSEYNNFMKSFSPESGQNDQGVVENFEKFLKENEKNFNHYELANAYLQLETYYCIENDLNNTKKFYDLVAKYSDASNYIFNLEGLNKVALCQLLLLDSSQLIDAFNNIANFMSKKSPFKDNDIKCLISNNMKHYNGELSY